MPGAAALRARIALRKLFTRRIRLPGSLIQFPLYSPILVFIIIIGSLVGIRLHARELVRQNGLRSHQRYSSTVDDVFYEGCLVPDTSTRRSNATLVMLARNQEVEDVVKSMQSLERHFNQWFGYPWVFLNDEQFTEEFKSEVTRHTKSECHFGTIPEEHWGFPPDVKASWDFREGISTQGDRGIMYGSMESYHKMCRFYSGFFYKHPLVRQYEWYWRVEPDVDFYCDITYDPFLEMEKHGKKYGFTIMIKELVETVPNLFRHTKAFLKKNHIKPRSAWALFVDNYRDQFRMANTRKLNEIYRNIRYLDSFQERAQELALSESAVKKMTSAKEPLNSDDMLSEEEIDALVNLARERSRLPTLQGETMDYEDYNLHHFWSNFEIARVDLWDNPIYDSYFTHLEQEGGFYKERWGDAPVHSLAVGFLLNLDELHYFRDIGYKHTTIRHCPANHPHQLEYEQSERYIPGEAKFEKLWRRTDAVHEYGLGCRCRCPVDELPEDIEDSKDDFLKLWFDLTRDDYKKENPINLAKEERKVKDGLRKKGRV